MDNDVLIATDTLDSLPIGAFLLDKEGVIRVWNRLLEDWTGTHRSTMLGSSLGEAFPHLAMPRYADRYMPIFDGGPPVVFSSQFHPHLISCTRDDGQKRIFQTVVTPLQTASGLLALFSIQDMTDLILSVRESRKLHQQALEELEQRKIIEQALQESSERVRSIVETSVEAIIVINTACIIEDFNPAAERLFGYTTQEVIGKNVNMLMPEPFHSEHDGYIARYLKSHEPHIIGIGREVTGQRKDSSTFPMRLAVSQMHIGEKILFTGILNDITEQKRLEEQLRTLSMKDGLTGINNRRFFDEALEREWRREQRSEEPISAILLDIDYFKRYNDTYGHQDGDNCLRTVASCIAAAVRRPGDVAARYGGEEFVVLLPLTQLNEAKIIAETIRSSVESLNIPHKNSDAAPHVTVSLGIAQATPTTANNPQHLLKMADSALYAAKNNGRNRAETAA